MSEVISIPEDKTGDNPAPKGLSLDDQEKPVSPLGSEKTKPTELELLQTTLENERKTHETKVNELNSIIKDLTDKFNHQELTIRLTKAQVKENKMDRFIKLLGDDQSDANIEKLKREEPEWHNGPQNTVHHLKGKHYVMPGNPSSRW